MLRQLRLVTWKSLIVRRRHILLTISEFLFPLLLFLMVAYGRSKIQSMSKLEIPTPTYNEPKSADLLFEQYFPVGDSFLLYTPQTVFTEQIMQKTLEKLNLQGDAVKGFHDENAALKFYFKNSNYTIIAVNFKGNESNFGYDIRFHTNFLQWDTTRLYANNYQYIPGTGSEKYFNQGFMAIQIALDLSFIELSRTENTPKIEFMMLEFPYPPYKIDAGLADMFMHFLPLMTIFSFIFLCPTVIKRVVEEKYCGIKELLKISGMKSWVFWSGWFIHGFMVNLISIFFIVLFMKTPLFGSNFAPIEYCDFSILTVFLILYCSASITFCFSISTFFKNPSNAMIFGILIWILSYFVFQNLVTAYENISWVNKMLFALFPNMALHFGYSAILLYETREVGANWSNFYLSASGGSNDITLLNVFVILIVDIVLYILLTLYVDNIKPGKYGIAKKFYFPFTYLKKKISVLIKKPATQIASEAISLNYIESANSLKPYVQIRNIYKKYGNFVAVNNLSLDIYENQITVLLGHNGAGKTTLMSMVTGMINSNQGTITIKGFDVKRDMDKIREVMGFCPQHNLLFPDLTVNEHMCFFSMLKGVSGKQAQLQVDELLKKLNLYEKRNDLACNLSGGMKRKLCLGMAVIGKFEILILDEPTSGMDPESRRELWNLLLEWRHNKTILLTTHFMEEADVLSDWIAIMANGSLQCYGTPMFLKNKYNTGYHLSVTLKSTDRDRQQQNQMINKITDIIKQKLDDVKLIRENANNLVYWLPIEKKQDYPQIFDSIENLPYIENVEVTETTLTEVYTKTRSNDLELKDKNIDVNSLKIQRDYSWCCIFPLVLKRLWFLRKTYHIYIMSCVLTFIVICMAIFLGEIFQDTSNSASSQFPLQLRNYGETEVIFSGNAFLDDKLNSKFMENYEKLIQKENSRALLVDDASKEIINKGIENIAFYKQHMVIGAKFDADEKNTILTAMYSNNALHGAPISFNAISNAFAKTLLGENYEIQTVNHPFENVNSQVSNEELSEAKIAVLWMFFIPLAMLFIMGSFLLYPSYELSNNFVQFQLMLGIKPFSYWLINFLFDFLFYIIMIIPVIILLGIVFYSSSVFSHFNELVYLTFILSCYGFAAIPYTYLFSYRKTLSSGFSLMWLFGLFNGIIPTIGINALEMSGDDYYENLGYGLKIVLLLLSPQFGLAYVIVKFTRKVVEDYNWTIMDHKKKFFLCLPETRRNACCLDDKTSDCIRYKSYLWNEELGSGTDLFIMLFAALIYLVILTFLSSDLCKVLIERILHLFRIIWIKVAGKLDGDGDVVDDVVILRDNYGKNIRHTGSFYANKLEKYFGRKKVVKNVSFSVKKGQCHGLLGVNGAGKTTTFRMLVRDIILNKGEIGITEDSDDKVISSNDAEYLTKIGYCPQYDALNYALTGRELLTAVAWMRGCSKQGAESIADAAIKIFELKDYADKPCGTYSGGNKRKLNLALSIIGLPKHVLLDEPTSGVDPVSRQNFWNILSKIKAASNVSFILTTHSMEECEALCDSIAIMKEGEIKCDDTISKLKEKYQTGYTVILKLKYDDVTKLLESKKSKKDDVEDGGGDEVDGLAVSKRDDVLLDLKDEFSASFDKVQLKDAHTGFLHYCINDKSKRLSAIFRIVENLKQKYSIIEDYSISETTLEDVFLLVAKMDT